MWQALKSWWCALVGHKRADITAEGARLEQLTYGYGPTYLGGEWIRQPTGYICWRCHRRISI